MKMLINGVKRDASDGQVIEVRNMATMELIDTVPRATNQDAQEALECAQEGAKVWAATPNYKRSQIINRFCEHIKANRDELSELLCKENGKPIQQARDEIDSLPLIYQEFAEQSKRMFGETIPLDIQEGIEKDLLITKREPLGVILGIVPFNFPSELFSHKAAASLVTGNAFIGKPPEDTPLTIIRLVELMHEAGIPGNVVQVITGFGEEVGDYLTSSPLVNAISFTGGTETGVQIYQNGAKNLSRVYLELGGNDPLIVMEDGDVDMAVNDTITWRLFNNGQVCCTNKRMLIHESVYEEYKRKLIERLSSKTLGNPMDASTDVGPLVSEKAAIKVEEQIQHTINQGAKLLLGGKRVNHTFIEPTVLDQVSSEMDVAKDMEIFGPVFPLITFKTLDEAVAITNASSYGLNAGVYTKNIYQAFEIGNKLQIGMISINGGTCYRPLCSAFGGYKKSGIGREGWAYTLEELTQIKSIVFRGVM